jgi:hypothetical protein
MKLEYNHLARDYAQYLSSDAAAVEMLPSRSITSYPEAAAKAAVK